MKKSIRFLALALAALTVLLCAACGTSSDTPGTTEAATEPAPTKLTVWDAEGLHYPLIRADEPPLNVFKAAQQLGNRLATLTGANEVYPASDFVMIGQTPVDDNPEILIGMTNRSASKAFYDRLPDAGYGYTVTDKQIVILGRTENLTVLAIQAFAEQVLPSSAVKTDAFTLDIGTEQILTFTGDMSTPYGMLTAGMTVSAKLGEKTSVGKLGKFGTAQGAASDGKYFYSALKKKVDNVETDVIAKTDMKTGKLVASSAEMPLDHCNDMCYNPEKNILVVPNMVGKRLTVIDPETLEMKESFLADSLPGTPYAISYNAANHCYVILAGSQVCFVDCDKFTVNRSFPLISMPYVGQGVDSDDHYVYVPMSKKAEAGTNDNVLVTYDIASGKVVAQIHIAESIEIETLINVDGAYYAHFNSGGSVFYRLKFEGYFAE